MNDQRLGRGELLLKYVAWWEWSFVGATVFAAGLVLYFSYLMSWINASFLPVSEWFGALIILEVIIVTHRILKRKRIIDAGALLPSKPPIPRKPISSDEKALAVIRSAMERTYIFNIYPDFRPIAPALRPQNILIVTDKHLLFVYAPLFLGDQVMGLCFVGGSNWKWANKEIAQSINGLLSTKSLKDVYESYPGNFLLAYDEIKSIKFSDWQRVFFINTKMGRSFTIAVNLLEDYTNGKTAISKLGFGK